MYIEKPIRMRYDDPHVTEIAGYQLAERLGSGGMGDVYKAYNPSLRRLAAVKILHQKDMAERFRNEAYIQSSVSHPNIACLYEYLLSGETPCIIMEYVEGESLDSFLHKHGKLSNGETENIIRQVASALSYLHKKGILHRDVKPQNFKIHATGKVTMLDFGIAKNKYTPKLTQQGFVVGTTEYMSPEQFQQRVEQKSDIWSLGVMTYELLTGYLPFEATNPITLRSKIEKGGFTDPKIMVPELSEKLKSLIDKSLRINPSSRISAAEIESLLSDKEQSEAVKKIKQFPFEFKFDNKILKIAAGAFLLIIAVIFIAKGTKDDDIVPGNNTEKIIAGKADQAAKMQKLTISVSSPSDAVIILPDGSSHTLPYDTTGKEGDKFEFTLEADGYVSRKVSGVEFTTRGYYNYNLEKK